MAKDYTDIDRKILEAIQSYQGIPSANKLSRAKGGPLEYSYQFIRERLNSNPELQKALESRGIEFVKTCNRKTFNRYIATKQLTRATGKIREAIDERLDRYILEAIQSYQGIPTSNSLSKEKGGPLEFSRSLIRERLNSNPELQKALESRGIEFVKTCDRETFDRCITTKQWTTITDKIREAIDERLDRYILEAIQSYQGIPTSNNLSKAAKGPLDYGSKLIIERLNSNPELQKALESRGLEFVKTCDRETFDKCITTCQWTQATGKIREAIDERLDRYILEAIQSYQGIPTSNSLSKAKGGPLEYSKRLIGKRLEKNPELRRAFYLKRGLTEDRINALEAEQENPSSAFKESIRRRLPNTRIFREALGILNQFRDIFFEKNTMEVSFYPEPLARAAQMLGMHLSLDYSRAHKLKRPDFRFETDKIFETAALLQLCHRLDQDSLINAFNEANRILAESGTLFISLPEEYSRTLRFESQVQDFGFELKTEGTLYTKTLGIGELAALGIEDPQKLKQKVEQATNLILLVKTRPAGGEKLDCFVPPKKLDGNGAFIPAMEEIDTPESLLVDLSSVFARKSESLEEGFILSVLHDKEYTERHVVGFDVNPRAPKTLETYSTDMPVLDPSELQRVTRRMSETSFREKVLVRPGKITRVPARLVRSALG